MYNLLSIHAQNNVVCMNPKPLNEHIKTERLELPFDSTVVSTENARYFTFPSFKFQEIPLNEASSKPGTIPTPYGRYKCGIMDGSSSLQKAKKNT
ncbi:hypothetical protein JTB14_008086 [Gonioctena quinquepunctata]|nr:hypothetical protein JTB14_008086 [Gonioctena quinquepunctata]